MLPFAWQEPVNMLISQFKYQDKLHYGKVLTTLLAREIALSYQQGRLPDLLVPVPLHPRKLRTRGYNQAVLMARQLSQTFAIPCTSALVKRIRDTPPQQGLGAKQRRRNLRGAFAVDTAEFPPPGTTLTIALVDDVVTTMSTVNTLAKVLHRTFPARLEIHLWALARA